MGKEGKKMKFKTWRPLKFKTVEDLQKKIEEYFDETSMEDYTITWLSLFLWFNSRNSLLNYEERPEFLGTIKRAKQMIEHSYEIDLKKHWRTWTIFALKNFEWKDKTEVDNNITWDLKVTNEEIDNKPVEELKDYLQKLINK